jgi:bla regulator protein BlaR1
MAFLTNTSTLTDQFIGALCNTLMHSLWQGLILSAVAGVIILSTKKSSSAMRYNLLITALLMFTILVGVTFAIQFDQGKIVEKNAGSLVINASMPSIITQSATVIEKTSFTTQLIGYLNAHHNTIVLIWFLTICAKSVQLVVGLLGIRRLKRVDINPANLYWTSKMQQLSNQLKIKEAVTLLESGLAKVPMVIGHLKPVILIPIGLLTALTTEEVEAILVHELAHIKRRDYLVNLLQSLVEIIFFFNPAVLWISQLIKTERENCCDDLAMAQSSSKVNYIRALVSCNEYQLAVPAYAVAFPGGKSSLLDRVKRLASNSNHSLNLFEKTVLAVCLVVSGLFLSAFSEKGKIRDIADKVATVIHNIQTKSEHKNLSETAIVKKESKAVKKKVAADHSDIFHPDDKDSITTVAVSNTINNLSFNTGAHLNLGSACLPPLAVQLAALNTKADVKLNSTMSLKSSVKINGTATDSSARSYNYKYDAKQNMWYDYKPMKDTSQKLQLKANQVVLKNFHPLFMPKLNIKLSMPSIADELFNADLIKDKKNFTAMLTNEALIVNGVKQSEENHQRILKLYQKKPDDTVNLSFNYVNN